MTPCQPSDRGSGTVLVVGGLGLLVTAVVLLAWVGSLLVAGRQPLRRGRARGNDQLQRADPV